MLLFGGIWPVTKDAMRDATPLWFALNRAAMAALVTALLLALLRRLRPPTRADLPCVVAIGLLQLGSFFALTHLALDWVPAGRTAILCNVTVFWLIPLSVWLLGERVSARQWAAAGVGLLGVLVLMAPWTLGDPAAAPMLLGYALLLLASLAWSLAILVTRRLPPRRPVLELLPWLAAPVGTWATIEAGRRLSGLLASLGFLVIPAVGVLLSNLWLGEALGLDVLLGGALIVGSVALAARG